jgi:hypothetical protein
VEIAKSRRCERSGAVSPHAHRDAAAGNASPAVRTLRPCGCATARSEPRDSKGLVAIPAAHTGLAGDPDAEDHQFFMTRSVSFSRHRSHDIQICIVTYVHWCIHRLLIYALDGDSESGG